MNNKFKFHYFPNTRLFNMKNDEIELYETGYHTYGSIYPPRHISINKDIISKQINKNPKYVETNIANINININDFIYSYYWNNYEVILLKRNLYNC